MNLDEQKVYLIYILHGLQVLDSALDSIGALELSVVSVSSNGASSEPTTIGSLLSDMEAKTDGEAAKLPTIALFQHQKASVVETTGP